jgi:hypothetical protein
MILSEDPRSSVVDVLRKDYEDLAGIIGRIDGYRNATRGLTFTLWAGALGLAFSNDSRLPLGSGMMLLFVLAWGDSKLHYQYEAARRRSIVLERTMQTYIELALEIGRPFEMVLSDRLDVLLDRYEFGSSLYLKTPRIGALFEESHRPSWSALALFGVLYVVLCGACWAVG